MPRPIYPVTISIPNKLYKKLGHTEAVRIGNELENHINTRFRDDIEKEAIPFFYDAIASEINTTPETVNDLLRPLGGGSGGITICNHNVKE